MKNTLTYQAASDTIRQNPQNYLIANRENGAWKCEFDLDTGYELKRDGDRVFGELLNYDSKYCQNAEELLFKILNN